MPMQYPAELCRRIDAAIERFWQDETGEEIGIIKRDRIFAFFNNLLGSAAYNQGVADAQTYLQTRLVDMEIELHEDVHERPGE
jgi:uncharacterized protein (DUF2164 family)